MADSHRPPRAMVVTRTPLRVSFAGGGTDLREFYRHGSGAVLSTTIDKFVYVTVKRHGPVFGERYRLNYFESEHVDRLEDIKNEIIRECLRLVPVEPPIYISTVADLPSHSGLGSSSAFAVGLLTALHAMRGERVSAVHVCQLAARVEIDVLARPMGKQDHAAAAFGGINFLRFMADERIVVEPMNLSAGMLERLFGSLQLYWTGMSRNSSDVLGEQQRNTGNRTAELTKLREQAEALRDLLQAEMRPEEFGRFLDEGWALKRRLASGISNDLIDRWYATAKQAGAHGGKIVGAGGGGFLLLVVPPGRQQEVRAALHDLVQVEIAFEPRGAHVMMPADE